MPLVVEAMITFPKTVSEKLKLIFSACPPFLYSPGVIPSIFTNRSCSRPVPDNPVSYAASNSVACFSFNIPLACSTLRYCRNFFGLTPAQSLNSFWKWNGLRCTCSAITSSDGWSRKLSLIKWIAVAILSYSVLFMQANVGKERF